MPIRTRPDAGIDLGATPTPKRARQNCPIADANQETDELIKKLKDENAKLAISITSLSIKNENLEAVLEEKEGDISRLEARLQPYDDEGEDEDEDDEGEDLFMGSLWRHMQGQPYDDEGEDEDEGVGGSGDVLERKVAAVRSKILRILGRKLKAFNQDPENRSPFTFGCGVPADCETVNHLFGEACGVDDIVGEGRLHSSTTMNASRIAKALGVGPLSWIINTAHQAFDELPFCIRSVCVGYDDDDDCEFDRELSMGFEMAFADCCGDGDESKWLGGGISDDDSEESDC